MKDGPAIKVIKRVALWRYRWDLALTRFLRNRQNPSRFHLGGSCNKCSLCCESPMIQTYPWLFRTRIIRWVFLWWHRKINGFVLTREEKKPHIFIFKCTHFNPLLKRCDSYDSRPGMCRDYPRNLLDCTYPDPFLKDCGFYPVDVHRARLKSSLQNLEISKEKREELETRLFLKD